MTLGHHARATTSLTLYGRRTPGEGISAEFLPQVFERFRQADSSSSRRHGGLGLGLSLVRQLVELHGGQVSATSVEGEGSRFTVTFPARTELTTEAAWTSTADLEPSGLLAGKRVLLVEDEADAREIMNAALQHYGVSVTKRPPRARRWRRSTPRSPRACRPTSSSRTSVFRKKTATA